MYQVYNMGIGFCLVVAAAQADRALGQLKDLGVEAHRLGTPWPTRNAGSACPTVWWARATTFRRMP